LQLWEGLQAHRFPFLSGGPPLQELAQALADQLVPEGSKVTLRTGLGDPQAASFARTAHSFIILEHAGNALACCQSVV